MVAISYLFLERPSKTMVKQAHVINPRCDVQYFQ